MSSNNNDFQSTIDEQLDKFDAAWHTAVTPDIHDHLPMPSSMPDAPRKRLLLELIKIDLEHRWKKYSEDPATIVSQEDLNVDDTANEKSECWTLEDYVRRFSELGSPQTLPAEVIAEEYRVRCRWGDCPSIDDYRSRFPLQQSQWWPLLDQITTELKNHEQRASRAVHPVDARELPEMIGRYRVLGRIDAGGQAQVFRAVHPTLQNEVIIKLGHRSLSLGSAERDRLVAEGRLLVELNHPNLARLYDLDFHGDRPFLVMDYIRGRNLRQYAAATRLPAKESARIIDAIAHALHDVHQRGIVHQDIKPANILISADGTPHLIDFGLARVSDAWKGETDKSTGISGTLQ
ncbi:MAG: serine/threonine protein kinase, partial [Planctomycetales bacterium]|nr:serine/threonine protein kinase [Planctomycetales bacterium]